MKNDNLTQLDTNQIQTRVYNEKNDTLRVELVGSNIVIPKMEMPDIKFPEFQKIEVPVIIQKLEPFIVEKEVIVKQYEKIEVPTIIHQTRIETIEKPIIVREIEFKEVQVPVIVEKLQVIEIPKYIEIDKKSDKLIKCLFIFQSLLTLITLAKLFIK